MIANRMATGDDPFGNARAFASTGESIRQAAERIRREYLEPEGEFRHGTSLRGLNVRKPPTGTGIAASRTLPFLHEIG